MTPLAPLVLPDDLPTRLNALKRCAAELEQVLSPALLNLRLAAQQRLARGEVVDPGPIDRVLAAVDALRDELAAAGQQARGGGGRAT